MNTMKYVLIFLAGVGAGAGGCAIYFKRKCDALVKKHDKELDEMDRYYQDNCNNCSIAASLDEEVEEEKEEEPKPCESKPEKRKGSFATPYGSYYSSEDAAEKEHPQEDEYVEIVKTAPKVIKKRDFGCDGYSTRVLYYYTEDDALIPEESTYEDIIDTDEVKDMLGNALDKYDFTTNDDDEICIRNFDRKCDYRIIKQRGSVSEDYGG